MDNKLKKYAVILCTGIVIGLVCYGVYALANKLIHLTYTSDEVVMDKFLEEQAGHADREV